MSCLPKLSCFKGFRRILSKMLPTSRQLWKCDDDKENVPLDLTISRSSESCPSSIWDTDAIYNIWKNPMLVTPLSEPKNDNYAIPKTYLNSSDGKEVASPYSSGYGSFSSNREGFKIFADELSKSYDMLFKPCQPSNINSSNSSNDQSSTFSFDSSQYEIPYSRLSSFTSNNGLPSRCLADFNFDEFSSSSQSSVECDHHDEIRREFETNGKTLEIDEVFTPPVSSTPMVNRRSINTFVPENSFRQRFLYPQTPSPPKNQVYTRNRKPKRKFKPNKKSLEDHCVFCKNNGASEQVFRTHTVKDAMGRVLCPVLRQYKCPICGEDGDKSHTVKYCPKKPIVTLEDLARMDASQH